MTAKFSVRRKKTKASVRRKIVAKRRTAGRAGQSRRVAHAAARGAAGDRTVLPSFDRKWSWHYRYLVALRARLAEDREAKFREAAEGVAPHSMHQADSATDEFDHDLALALLAREENAVTEVSDAINRILKGTYGVCEETGARIPAPRLRAVPWCRYTRDVEERLEKSGAISKCHLPPLVSLRGAQPGIPDSGGAGKEGGEGGTVEEADEVANAKVVRAMAVTPLAEMGNAPTPPAPPPGAESSPDERS